MLLYFSSIQTTCTRKHKSRQLSCSNTSRCIFINKQTKWTMKHASTVAAKTKASSLIRWIKNHSKILKLLQFKKFYLINPDFWSFWKKGKAYNANFLYWSRKQDFKISEIDYRSINGRYISISPKKAISVDL